MITITIEPIVACWLGSVLILATGVILGLACVLSGRGQEDEVMNDTQAQLNKLIIERGVDIICPYCDNTHRVLESEGTHIKCLCGASGRYQRLGKIVDWFWINYGVSQS